MAWWQYARVGQKVVCVRKTPPQDNWMKCFPGAEWPKKDDVLTIRNVFQIANDVGLRFCEIRNAEYRTPYYLPYNDGSFEPAFSATLFRPIQDTTDQVEALKKLCNPAPQKQGVPV